MIPNVTRGSNVIGLMAYLADDNPRPDRKRFRYNVHENPHLVAGDEALMTWHGGQSLAGPEGQALARKIGRHLDRPHRTHGVDVRQRVYKNVQSGSPGSGGVATMERRLVQDKSAPVWHCSLSLPPEDGMLTDEQWQVIAEQFVRRMGFVGEEQPWDVGTPDCRWVAVRHGVSENGNDHVHIAVQLVRDDGTVADVNADYRRAQEAARELERSHGLTQLQTGLRAERAAKPGEREAEARRTAERKYETFRQRQGGRAPAWQALPSAHRQGRIRDQLQLDAPRTRLARTVRAAATAAQSEAEFVRRIRQTGVLVRPRFAEGRRDVIEGYSVAYRSPGARFPTVWYGGGRLARDLGLTRLRESQGWTGTAGAENVARDPEQDSSTDELTVGGVESAMDAAAEWNAAYDGKPIVAGGRETVEADPELWQRYAGEIKDLRTRLASVPVEDVATWAQVARDTSGVLAAWAQARPELAQQLGEAADVIGRSAQTVRRPPIKAERAGRVALSGTAALIMGNAGHGLAGQQALMIALRNLARSVYDARLAEQDAHAARRIAEVAKGQLTQVRDLLGGSAAAQSSTRTAAAVPSAEPAHPAARPLYPDRDRALDRGGPER